MDETVKSRNTHTATSHVTKLSVQMCQPPKPYSPSTALGGTGAWKLSLEMWMLAKKKQVKIKY